MRKLIVAVVLTLGVSGCLIIMPLGMTPAEERLWKFQNERRIYYYKEHPIKYNSIKRNRVYKRYFVK